MVTVILFSAVTAGSTEKCPNLRAFLENGWVVHCEKEFKSILEEKLLEFTPQFGSSLVLDHAEYYRSEFSYNYYLAIWVVIWDRISTDKDEMWGDVAFSLTGPGTKNYIEIRWYDPLAKKKHIVCNPDYLCCLSTKIPLAYNTIF